MHTIKQKLLRTHKEGNHTMCVTKKAQAHYEHVNCVCSLLKWCEESSKWGNDHFLFFLYIFNPLTLITLCTLKTSVEGQSTGWISNDHLQCWHPGNRMSTVATVKPPQTQPLHVHNWSLLFKSLTLYLKPNFTFIRSDNENTVFLGISWLCLSWVFHFTDFSNNVSPRRLWRGPGECIVLPTGLTCETPTTQRN